MSTHASPPPRAALRGDLALTTVVFAIGALVLLLRRPIPVDETRYLEVFRESLTGNPLLLHLMGEPYPEKPPLLFWLARVLTWLGCSQELALRSIPVVSTALTVLFIARIGRHAGLRLAGAVQAALLLPLLGGQFLLFDPLLACGLWGALLGWVRGRDEATAAGLAVALLAKGPVALLFFLPLAWSLAPLRVAPPARLRVPLVVGVAMLPLAAWALAAAWRGGPEFAQALLWGRWAGRLTNSFAHQRPIWFYVPLAIVGALPTTIVAARTLKHPAAGWEQRTAWALLFLLAAFTAISGKQPHYLIPATPALALVLAGGLESGRVRVQALHVGVQIELAALLLVLAVGGLVIGSCEDSFGAQGRTYLRSGAWMWPWACGALALGLGSLLAVRWRASASRLLVTTLLSTGACLVCLHTAAGRLLFPHELADVLDANPGTPVAFLGTSHHGLYSLLGGERVTRLEGPAALGPWGTAHPGGIVMLEDRYVADGTPAGFDVVTHDVVHRCDVVVLRAAGGHAPPSGHVPEAREPAHDASG